MKIPEYRISLVRERVLSYRKLDSSRSTAAVLHAMLDDADREKIVTLYVNGVGELIGAEIVAIGSMHQCGVVAKDVFRGAIVGGAAAIILGHNHLSGDPTPSSADIDVTKMLSAAGALLGCKVLDHVIVSPNGRDKSMFDLGLIEA